MVKKRTAVDVKADKFGNAANIKNKGGSLRAIYDPKDRHTFTTVTIRLNQFEAELFQAAADDADRKTVDWMRRTLVKAAEDQLGSK